MEDDKVIEMVNLTRSETGSSWKIKTQALELALKILQDKGITIGEVIHDDNAQVDAILKAHNIVSQKDLWHKCKNVMGKFKENLQEKRTLKESIVKDATTIAEVAVFSIVQLKEYCQEHDLPQSGSKLQLVQRVSVHLKLPEAGASPGIQRQRPLKYPKLAAHDIAYKLKSWIYTCAKNAALRGSHNLLAFTGRGETHKAVKEFLKKYITETKMKCYIRARENFISETFHSVINKFTMKRIHFDASHTARLACAAMDWNKNIRRDVRATYQRASNDIAVRRRAKTCRVLVERTSHWKKALAAIVLS
ncbi:hypothetical protein R1flu_001160 [Riccia fluitans]|uniref:SAP domain-containing protein n=1 Tax=Riccia fluitans TaxID=41844 RepID=A0ABD1Y2I0_9MARC